MITPSLLGAKCAKAVGERSRLPNLHPMHLSTTVTETHLGPWQTERSGESAECSLWLKVKQAKLTSNVFAAVIAVAVLLHTERDDRLSGVVVPATGAQVWLILQVLKTYQLPSSPSSKCLYSRMCRVRCKRESHDVRGPLLPRSPQAPRPWRVVHPFR